MNTGKKYKPRNLALQAQRAEARKASESLRKQQLHPDPNAVAWAVSFLNLISRQTT